MPSFYPPTMPRHLPLTPPEFCGQYPYSASLVPQQKLYSNGNEYYYDHVDKYPAAKQPAHMSAPATAQRTSYGGGVAYQAAGFTPGNQGSRENVYGAIAPPVLPPIRVPESLMDNGQIYHHPAAPVGQVPEQAPPKEEKVAGGVAAQLDYEMDQMIDYVADMAQGMYALYQSRFCLADIDLSRSVQPQASVSDSFRSYVSQILTSTRLPKATIFLALHYLGTRMTMLSDRHIYASSTGHLFHMLTTALMLASKFLDDNTFQNRSWSEVSHIPVADLNAHEMEWLVDIKWDLHADWADPQGVSSWFKSWDRCQARKLEQSMEALKLTPLDTNNLRMRSSVHAYIPQTPYSPSYAESVYGMNGKENRTSPPWQQWLPLRDLSPPPLQSGPNSPDWFTDASGGYGQPSRMMAPVHVLPSSQSPLYSGYPSHYSSAGWNGHAIGCHCGYCFDRYSMHGFGMQSVAC